MPESFDLDELLGTVEPIATVTIGGNSYEFWNPQHISEGDRLRFIDAQATLYSLAIEIQKENEAVREKIKTEATDEDSAGDAEEMDSAIRDELVKLMFSQRKMDVNTIAPSRCYLEALAQKEPGTFAFLKPFQISKLMEKIQPLAVKAENGAVEDEPVGNEGAIAPLENPEGSEPMPTNTLAA